MNIKLINPALFLNIIKSCSHIDNVYFQFSERGLLVRNAACPVMDSSFRFNLSPHFFDEYQVDGFVTLTRKNVEILPKNINDMSVFVINKDKFIFRNKANDKYVSEFSTKFNYSKLDTFPFETVRPFELMLELFTYNTFRPFLRHLIRQP